MTTARFRGQLPHCSRWPHARNARRRAAARAHRRAPRTRVRAAATGADIQRAINAAYTKYKDLHEGKNADYIPALAKVDPNLFGIALVTPDGQVYVAGDNTTQVSIQSISKVFTLARVLQDSGEATSSRTPASTPRARCSTRSSPSSRAKATR
jgi:hypothetical protein